MEKNRKAFIPFFKERKKEHRMKDGLEDKSKYQDNGDDKTRK